MLHCWSHCERLLLLLFGDWFVDVVLGMSLNFPEDGGDLNSKMENEGAVNMTNGGESTLIHHTHLPFCIHLNRPCKKESITSKEM